ncbi:MAG: ATP-dependent endonuclease [Rhizobiales bacterium]|nr:ATP-dependent endonuclease [Hyphomicrobiales bacterium]
MQIEKITVEGFRLLRNVEIMLEAKSTVIVGRNNSGKTSLTDVFDRFAGEDGARFRLEDFSAGARAKFLEAKALREGGAQPDVVLAALPKIAATLTFAYEQAAPDLGPLPPFIIDLDPGSSIAIARVEFAATLQTAHFLFDPPPAPEGADEVRHYYRFLREAVPKAYSIQVVAVDPTDPTNQRRFDGVAPLSALLQCSFVRAQRTLDHSRQGDPDVIGKLLGKLFKTANSPSAAATDQSLAAELKTSVDAVEQEIQGDFDEMLKGLLPALAVFGFPSLNDTELRPETSLNVESLLSDHTKIVYAGQDGVHLPEGYNGLGTRNLIYMLLQLESFHKGYRARPTRPGSHLVFIEEPEAHLHPQMQEVFIKQLNEAVSKLSEAYPDEPAWPVQFVVSTHSPHVANAATFEAVRYFLSAPPTDSEGRQTAVKDFKKGAAQIPPEDREFLHQYMTLTKCDLYFADKAIIVEGTTERILMPRLCSLVDETLTSETQLARQYVTTVEIGGAYAHLFYPLLDFLELKTLIITDLDAVRWADVPTKKGGTTRRLVKCPVAEGERTSNKAIEVWFKSPTEGAADGDADGDAAADVSEVTPLSLPEVVAKTKEEKERGSRRLAYQIPEEGSDICARSFEDAFVLANPDKFDWPREDDVATEAWDIAQGLPKAETALKYAIQETEWNVPLYIREGLIWLSEPPPPAAASPLVAAGGSAEPEAEAGQL